MTDLTTAVPVTSGDRLRQRLRLCVAIATALLVLLVMFHAPLLRRVHAGLVVDEQVGRTNYTIVMFGDGASMNRARDRLKSGETDKVLVLEMHLPRTVEMGMAPRMKDVVQSELVKMGCQASAIESFTSHSLSPHESFRKLAAHLHGADDPEIAVLCPHDRTRYMHMVLNDSLSSEIRSHWHVCAVEVYGYNEARWWRDRNGWKRLTSAWLRQCHLVLFGEPPAAQPWNPDDYERRLAVAP